MEDDASRQVVPGCRPYWYCCDEEDDAGWGCGYRCCQMLVHQFKRKKQDESREVTLPSIRQIIDRVNDSLGKHGDEEAASLPMLKWGDWMTLEHIIRFFQTTPDLTNGFEYFIFERLDRRQGLVAKLEDHLSRHNSLIIAEGTGMIFCIGGLRRSTTATSTDDAGDVQLYILDPHGPPSSWSGSESDEPFRFKGGSGWIGFYPLFFGTCLDEFFAAFPERKTEIDAATIDISHKKKEELYADVMDICGGWRFLFIHPSC